MTAPILSDSFAHGALASSGDLAPTMPGQSAMIDLVAGTRVATPMGYVAVERLCAGDGVLTADGCIAPLVWVGITHVVALGAQAPVCIATGVMNNMRPVRLSQHNRIRVAGWRAEACFDADAVLTAAGTLVNGIDIVIETSSETVRYVQLMLDQQAVILVENIACETYCAGRGIAVPRASAADDMVLRAA